MEAIINSLATTSSSTTPALGPTELGKDEFLLLLVTQLQNQNPLQPIDNAAFVAELAQFSELEQSAKQVDLLEQSLEAQAASLQFSMLPLVGRDIRIEGSVIEFTGDPAPVEFTLESAAAAVRVTILDLSGQVIRTMDLGPHGAGFQETVWDGKDANGTPMASGTYGFAVTATDGTGAAVAVKTTFVLNVQGIRMENGTPLLLVGGGVLDPSFIIDVL